MNLYDREVLVKLVSDSLKYFENSKNKNEVIKAAQLLMTKIKDSTDKVELDSNFIENILFIQNEDGTKNIVMDVYYVLRRINADMKGVSFDNVYISGIYFNGLKNVEINIDKIPNKDISSTNFEGVKLIGSLDNAKIDKTNFTGYIGDLTLNPQTIQDKNLYLTHLCGINVNGPFDGVCISGMRTEGFKGEIIINPQTVKEKDLTWVDFNGIKLVGEYREESKTYDDACFDECQLSGTSFKNCIGKVVINVDKIGSSIVLSNLTGVELVGDISSVDMFRTYYEDENGNKIYLDEKTKETKDEDSEKSIEKVKRKKSIFLWLKNKAK